MGACQDCERCTASSVSRLGRGLAAIGTLGLSEVAIGVGDAFKRTCPTCDHPLALHGGARVHLMNPPPVSIQEPDRATGPVQVIYASLPPAPQVVYPVYPSSPTYTPPQPPHTSLLAQCGACGNAVSVMAHSCPKCGHPQLPANNSHALPTRQAMTSGRHQHVPPTRPSLPRSAASTVGAASRAAAYTQPTPIPLPPGPHSPHLLAHPAHPPAGALGRYPPRHGPPIMPPASDIPSVKVWDDALVLVAAGVIVAVVTLLAICIIIKFH